MSEPRISIEKRVFIISALIEGTPINAVCRMFKVGGNAVKRVIEETCEALSDHMRREFRDLPCAQLELDEQWQYVGQHGQRMAEEVEGRGDFWLWAAIDPDTKLVVSYRIGRRTWQDSEDFIRDLAGRVGGHVQIATDNHRSYANHIKAYFDSYSYGTETKNFTTPFNPEAFPATRKNGVPKVAKATRKAVAGHPDLRTVTTSHVERLFLTVRQELARFPRQTLAYSKDLRMHKLAVNMQLGIYNLVRKHRTLGTTPAVAAGLEEKPWTIEDVVRLTEAYVRRKEDAAFEAAFAEAGMA